ncbi:MAG: glycosyltransferase family 39 protein [Thaumarchaeota archaeon]|nr:MAG: glycosyltransferase family 39 protein [Nitrososphaerota archaeon]
MHRPQQDPSLQEPVKLEPAKAVLGYLKRAAAEINITHLLLILFALHLFALSFPSDTSNGGGRVFDEAFYVPAAQDILHGVASNLEHPFFGKVWGALGISIFGDNFFGWRIFYALIGVVSVWVMYELAKIFFSKENALFAASMLGFESVFFVHTSLLLLDGPPILFGLLGFLAYFKGRQYLSALAFGLSILSKETGVFFLLALGLYHLWASRRSRSFNLRSWKSVLRFVAIVVLVVGIPLWTYDSAYLPYTSSTVVLTPEVVINPVANSTTTTTLTTTTHSGYVTNPLQNLQYYFTYQSSLVGCGQVNAWNCYPWSWILPLNVGPLQYFVSTVTVKTSLPNGTVTSQIQYHPIDWQGMGNLVVWYSIWLIVPVTGWKLLKRKAGEADVLAACLIAATYLPLFYISLVSHRVEYAFYFINTDPGLALGIPLVTAFLARGSERTERRLLLLWVGAAIIFFMFYFPVNPFAFR